MKNMQRKLNEIDIHHQQQQHTQLVSQRNLNFDCNGNANNNNYQQSTKDFYNLPDVNHLNNHANRVIAKQTAKKMIKVFNRINYLFQ